MNSGDNQPTHVFKHLTSTQLSPRGDTVFLFSPLFPFLSLPPSVPTCQISYSKLVCLEMSARVKECFWLCNTLIYALSLSLSLFCVGFCVWKRLYICILKRPYPDSWPKIIPSLYGFCRLDFFIWQKCGSARFQQNTRDLTAQSLYPMTSGQKVNPWSLHLCLPF